MPHHKVAVIGNFVDTDGVDIGGKAMLQFLLIVGAEGTSFFNILHIFSVWCVECTPLNFETTVLMVLFGLQGAFTLDR